MKIRSAICGLVMVIMCGAITPHTFAGGGALPDNDVVMRALVEELTRSVEELKLDDLPTPYFIQYSAEDRLTYTMQASYGGLIRDAESRARSATSRVRVGSFELDNTNVGRAMGGRVTLPIDDDETALRHALWQMTDVDYKRAVETLTRKKAYLEQKNIEDRPDDYAPGTAVHVIEPSAEIAFDRDLWRKHIQQLSARFEEYPDIQQANVNFFAGAVNEWFVNTEGTRIRTGDMGFYLTIGAQLQASDGMHLGDRLSYIALQSDDLPSVDQLGADIDGLCGKLAALSKAPILEHYTGPVLFEPVAAAMAFGSLLAQRVCARPIPLGAGGWADNSLEKQLGRRILPRSFNMYDDPTIETFEGTLLAGSYSFDEEGVASRRVSLVESGILKNLLAGRAPTRKIKKTTGHARGSNFGDPQATIGCLYIEDANAMTAAELKAELLQAARDEGLEFALRIESLSQAGGGDLGSPIAAYKVYVEDGREELIRGMKFASVDTRSLKRILAAGTKRGVLNMTTGMTASIVCPAVIFEELELNKIEREFDKPPILDSPAQRSVDRKKQD